jgi:poly-gamma-glutamate capsule biosynthesis protein CapA/YwtB (metallophosphatase superfamily)
MRMVKWTLVPAILTHLLGTEVSNSNMNKSVTITAVGDVTLAGNFNRKMEELKESYEYPFNKVKKHLEDSITIANLETALTEYDKKTPKKFNFKGKPEYVKCLTAGSIEIVNIANNHSFDYGEKGLEDTVKALENENIAYCGGGLNIEKAREPKIVEKDGIKIAFLGYAQVGREFKASSNKPGIVPSLENYVKEDVRNAKEKVDIVVVSFHYGVELAEKPNEHQKVISRIAIDSGADIVLGHHPHVVQGVEQYKKGIIFYSLGNFCFGGNSNPIDKDSFIAKIKVNKYGIQEMDIIPIKTSSGINNFQPYEAEGIEKERIAKKIMGRL